jgi:hypothetical protein
MPELRQLKQRIGMLCTIPPMTPMATRNYVRTRLRMAGVRDAGIFTDEALGRIAAYAGGIPRIVNTVCDHCLLIGYADQTRRIDPAIVDQAVSYLQAGVRPQVRRQRQRPRPAAVRSLRRKPAPISSLRWGLIGMSAAIVAGVVAVAFTHPDLLPAALDSSTFYLTDLARTVRDLVTK